MTRRLGGPNLQMLFATLSMLGVLVVAILSSEPSILYEKALGQNATSKNMTEQAESALDSIDMAREALRNNDSSKALDEINAVETELFKITQNLQP